MIELPELLNRWLQENWPEWQVFYGAYIMIGLIDNMERWRCKIQVYVGSNRISVYRNIGDAERCEIIYAVDPKFFEKLNKVLEENKLNIV